MNPTLTHNSVRPIKYMTVMCLGGAVLYCQGRLWSRTAIATDFPINTLKPPGSASEPQSVQLDSPSARLCFSLRVGSGDSGRAIHILLFPWCVPPKWKTLTLTIYLICAKNCDRHRRYRDGYNVVLTRSLQSRKSKRSSLQSPSSVQGTEL